MHKGRFDLRADHRAATNAPLNGMRIMSKCLKNLDRHEQELSRTKMMASECRKRNALSDHAKAATERGLTSAIDVDQSKVIRKNSFGSTEDCKDPPVLFKRHGWR